MTRFEQMLLDKGYIKHILNCKTMKFEEAKGHTISTMVNLDHRYVHNTDENILRIICFGLHEAGKPPTLISPRPRIEVKRIKDGKEIIENELYDDSMNVVLKNIPHEEIYKAMYDKSIIIRIDLT